MRKHNFFAIGIMIISMLLSTGCNNSKSSNGGTKEESIQSDTDINFDLYYNTDIPIYDINSREIGSITCFNYSLLVDKYILYSKLPKNNVEKITEIEYHLYDIDTKEDYLLSTIRDWYYEETYEAVSIDDHLYISVSTGEYANRENSTQTIYDINLKEHQMSPLLEVAGGIPYNSYTIVGDTLVLAELLDNGDTDIITCNIYSDTLTVHIYDESEYFVHDSIRHITTDQEFIYMIRLDWDDNENTFLYLDKYDLHLNLISTIDITNSCVSSIFTPESNADELNNERKQFICDFFVDDALFYYHNFSVTTFLGAIENNNLERLYDTNELFSYVNKADQSDDSHLFIDTYGDDTDKRNTFYLINSKDQKISTAQFFASEPELSFRRASINENGMILLTMGYVPLNDGERLSECVYYFDINDLVFEPVE